MGEICKGKLNLELEPNHFINRSEGSSILSKKDKSLRSKKEEIREEGKANVPIRVKRVMTEKQSGYSTKELTMRPTRRLYQDVQCRKCKEEKEFFEHLSTCSYDKEAWAKKEEEILNSIKEELKQKKKINLGFLADDIGLALERINLSKNKAQDTAVAFINKWLTFFQREVWKEHAAQ
ncbi:37268_t:CDS:2 [Gigaspora margarita]|uniref:37268_t:CDS:1 n=1 Tax=Gigaspora margarita TaxID=4874 RepID=A0ABM8W315_GIGMA|nr:37268_t:CDS:2 [Gigaspora margarita]